MTAAIRLAVVSAVLICALTGWGTAGSGGLAAGLALGLVLFVLPWWGQPLWVWSALKIRRNRALRHSDPVTVANDRSSGGVRYQGDVVVTAVAILGKAHRPTFLGPAGADTANFLDIGALLPLMRQSLGLNIESLSVVTVGARCGAAGDYPRLHDSLIGAQSYAGQRETWLVIRIRVLANADALRWRVTVGTAAVAASQRIAATLRRNGIRSRVASATDIVELERRLGRSAVEPHNRRWHTLRGETGWLTTYAYRPADISADTLAQAWSLRTDGVIQNITLFPDGRICATVTVRSAQPPTAPPSVAFRTLPGRQTQAFAASLCGPRPHLRGVSRGPLCSPLRIPLGPSGVLIGRLANGDRLLLPLAGENSRIHITAEDAIAKRLIIRAAGAGERISLHTSDLDRWYSVRMPNIAVMEQSRPTPGTTVSVVDGTIATAVRTGVVISVSPAGTASTGADVVVAQTGPTTVQVHAAGVVYDVEVDFYRAENRYVATSSVLTMAGV